MSRSEIPPYLQQMSRIVEPAPEGESESARRERISARIQSSALQFKTKEAHRIRGLRKVKFAALATSTMAMAAGVFLWLNAPSPAATDMAASSAAVSNSSLEENSPTPSAATTLESKPSRNEDAAPHLISDAVLLSGELLSQGEGLELGMPLSNVGRLDVGAKAPAVIRLANQARVEAAPGSILQFTAKTTKSVVVENIELRKGSVSLDVPKLALGQRLTVSTAEALIEVRGTAFVVTRASSHRGASTEVSVAEGLVAVKMDGATHLLRPGESWKSNSKTSTQRPRVEPPVKRKAPLDEVKAPTTPTPASDLAEQNRLYQSAMMARRNGMVDLAKIRLKQLLAQYPSSPLASGARRELLRLDHEGDK